MHDYQLTECTRRDQTGPAWVFTVATPYEDRLPCRSSRGRLILNGGIRPKKIACMFNVQILSFLQILPPMSSAFILRRFGAAARRK